MFPETLASHPYYIDAMVTGKSHWGDFGYDVCPSVSVDHPQNAERINARKQGKKDSSQIKMIQKVTSKLQATQYFT